MKRHSMKPAVLFLLGAVFAATAALQWLRMSLQGVEWGSH